MPTANGRDDVQFQYPEQSWAVGNMRKVGDSSMAQAFLPMPVTKRDTGKYAGGRWPKVMDPENKQPTSLGQEMRKLTSQAQQPYPAIAKAFPKAQFTGTERSKNVEDLQGQKLQPTDTTMWRQRTEKAGMEWELDAQKARQKNPTYFAGAFTMKGQAMKDLNLTQQESYLYDKHLDNLRLGGVRNLEQQGGISTLYAGIAQVGDKYHVFPTIWEGKKLSGKDAMNRAASEGWDKFPSYDSEQEADERYAVMHRYMDMDTR